MTNELSGKTAIVTGGGRGIGKAICTAIADRGGNVIIADIDNDSVEKMVTMLKEKMDSDCQCLYIQTDISSEKAIKQLYAKVKERFKKIDILINNAGIFKNTPIVDIEVDEWDKIMAVNLRGTFLMGREALKIMRKQKSGKIVNICPGTFS